MDIQNLPNKAFLEIAKTIQQQLKEGLLRQGDRLPSERALAETHQTSRATVREALRALEIIGLIESKVGHGTFIKSESIPANDQLFTEIANETSPSEVFEARFSIEPYLAELAAVRATQEDLKTLEQILEDTRDCIDFEELTRDIFHKFERLDGQFHYQIALAAKNSFLLRVIDIINSVRLEKLWGTLKERSLTKERMNTYFKEHCEIFKAIKDRDKKKAAHYSLVHLKNVRNNMLEE
ncbi:FadR/GntR family transcriptional regulator [Ammoniphilus sp. YIM 78166]|uniref:FadR/GntR family transcriptional regulator n=1 Tax=Ammoniphilus sp. YIM 78166 TaxID=1644106 RepID=UPI00106F7C8A|nr:FadR/GntR family transcriptional regulator [Ammoniphilus sp. YIM 78166]